MFFQVLGAAVPVVVMLGGGATLLLIVYFWREARLRHPRRSPLTRDLLRGPGHSLRERISNIDGDISGHFALLLLCPLLAYSIFVSQSYFGGSHLELLRLTVSIAFGVVTVVWFGRGLWRKLHERKRLALALDGELAVGEELNQLMLVGCRVFHDVPFSYGNIDHVVVCPTGVYAINTKMRGKPHGRGNANAEATFEAGRNVIRFPDGEFKLSLSQIEAESRWLTEFLTAAVGHEVRASSMLAFPGWFIRRTGGQGAAYVFNPRHCESFFQSGKKVLSDELIQRIAHQLDQLCRDIEARPPSETAWSEKGARTPSIQPK